MGDNERMCAVDGTPFTVKISPAEIKPETARKAGQRLTH